MREENMSNNKEPLSVEWVLNRLRDFGTAQNRKIYIRHGANTEAVYGVSFANLNSLVKKIKINHPLACELWANGNYDARNLATKIADPALMKDKDAQEWIAPVDNYLHASLLGGLLARCNGAQGLVKKWTASQREFVKQSGYAMLSALLKENADALSDEDIRAYLTLIENEIHTSPNWARYSMNWTLIAIGIYKSNLMEESIRVSQRIGKVEVDHGETSCKTPDAAAYIVRSINSSHRKKTHC